MKIYSQNTFNNYNNANLSFQYVLDKSSKTINKTSNIQTPIFTSLGIKPNFNLDSLNLLKYNNIVKTNSIKNTELETFEKIISSFNFNSFGKSGLPLKYPREQFIKDLNGILNKLSFTKRENTLLKFDMQYGKNDIDGIPVLSEVKLETDAEKEVANLIQKFYSNKILIEESSGGKVLNQIITKFPEFNMVIGKQQHETHHYSVDIHSLEALKKIISNEDYKKLTDENKINLIVATLLHDIGKFGNVITPGHALYSHIYAQKILKNHNLAEKSKNIILNLIKNHHWFDAYNNGNMTAQDFAKMFPSKDERTMAILFAQADFTSISPNFHLQKLISGEYLTPEEFQLQIKKIFENLKNNVQNV